MKVTVEIAEVHKLIREIEVPDNATDLELRLPLQPPYGVQSYPRS